MLLVYFGTVVMIALASAEKPGFQTRITQRALDYANQQAVDELAVMVPKEQIPDVQDSGHHFEYSLTKIRLSGFVKPGSSIKLVPNTGLTWSATNLGLSLHADWRVKYKKGIIKASFSGSVDATIEGVSFSVTLAIGSDSAGKPTIKAAGCTCSVSKVRINIHGKLRYIADLFKRKIEGKVQSIIPSKVCDLVNKEINNNAKSHMEKLKVMVPLLKKKFMLDYRLVANPSFQTAYMETYHKGEITWTANPQQPPFSPEPMPPSTSTSNMLYLWIGEYVPQSFAYAAQQNGFLKYNLTGEDLPADQRGFLNTSCTLTCIGNLIPNIRVLYPGSTVEIRMNSTSIPSIHMAPNDLGAKFTGDMALYAHTPEGKIEFLLTLGVSASFNMTATVSNQVVMGNISDFSFTVEVKRSAVGPVFATVLNTIVGFSMKYFIIPKLNAQGNVGFPLPVTDDFSFVNTQLHIQQGALMIGTDLVYKGK